MAEYVAQMQTLFFPPPPFTLIPSPSVFHCSSRFASWMSASFAHLSYFISNWPHSKYYFSRLIFCQMLDCVLSNKGLSDFGFKHVHASLLVPVHPWACKLCMMTCSSGNTSQLSQELHCRTALLLSLAVVPSDTAADL